MSSLDALLAPFIEEGQNLDAGEESSYAYEPFGMPPRAFSATLKGYEAELAAIEAMDAKLLTPAFSETPFAFPVKSTIDTSPLAEAGANTTTQLAGLARGLQTLSEIDHDVPEIVWQCGLGGHIWENLGLLRAGKALVYNHFIGQNKPLFVLKIYAKGAQAHMTEADGYTNLLRLSTMSLTAHMAGVEFLHLPAFAKSANNLPDLAERIQEVTLHESQVHAYAQAQKGAFWPSLLAAKLVRAATALANSGQDLQTEASRIFALKKMDVATGKRVWVGQTKYANRALTIAGPDAAGQVEWAVDKSL